MADTFLPKIILYYMKVWWREKRGLGAGDWEEASGCRI